MRTAARPSVLLALLVLAVGINYVDRGSLSVAKTDVAKAFDLDQFEMGLLLSAFFWSYAVFQIAAGWLVDRYDVKWVYAAGFFAWSLAMIATGLAGGFVALLAMRMLLGIGESVAYPSTSRVIVENFPERRRGSANALVDAGSKIGTALSILLGGLIVAEWGWRRMFLTIGVISLAWLAPWIAFAPSGRGKHRGGAADDPAQDAGDGVSGVAPDEAARVSFGQLLARREVWGTSLGFFCLGYAWYFLVTWLPAYLEEARGFSKETMAVFGSLPFWAMAATSIASGWLSDAWIAGGAGTTLVRKGFLIAGFLLCAGCLSAVAFVPSDAACVVLLTAACGSLGLYSSNAWAVTQTLAGPAAAGRWSGVKNAVGNLGGVASPAVTGWIVQTTGSYVGAFAAAALMLWVGVFAYVLLVGRIAPLRWDRRKD